MASKIKLPQRGRKRTRVLPPIVQRAVDAVGGTVTALAAKIDLSTQAVSVWNHVPVAHLLSVEKATKIPREELRPDLFDRNYRNGGSRLKAKRKSGRTAHR